MLCAFVGRIVLLITNFIQKMLNRCICCLCKHFMQLSPEKWIIFEVILVSDTIERWVGSSLLLVTYLYICHFIRFPFLFCFPISFSSFKRRRAGEKYRRKIFGTKTQYRIKEKCICCAMNLIVQMVTNTNVTPM